MDYVRTPTPIIDVEEWEAEQIYSVSDLPVIYGCTYKVSDNNTPNTDLPKGLSDY